MPTRKFGRPAIVSFTIAAGLVLMLLAVNSFKSQDAIAQQGAPSALGDGTQIFGGAAAGAAGTVNVAVAASANYIISATVPAGGNFAGAVILITYDPTKATPSCSDDETGVVISACNPAFTANQIKVAISAFENQGGQSVGVTGTSALATISFLGVAATANAITSIVIDGVCINGASETITCSVAGTGALVVGGAVVGGKWGDTNCSGTVNAADITNVKRASVGLSMNLPAPANCAVGFTFSPADLNCSGAGGTGIVNAADITAVKRLSVGLPLVNPPVGCPPAGWTAP